VETELGDPQRQTGLAFVKVQETVALRPGRKKKNIIFYPDLRKKAIQFMYEHALQTLGDGSRSNMDGQDPSEFGIHPADTWKGLTREKIGTKGFPDTRAETTLMCGTLQTRRGTRWAGREMFFRA